MKRSYGIYIVTFFVMFFLFSGVYYISYQSMTESLRETQDIAENQMQSDASEMVLSGKTSEAEEDNQSKEPYTVKSGTAVSQTAANESPSRASDEEIAAAQHGETTVSRKMTYILEQYNPNTQEITEVVQAVPDDLIGMNRAELVSYLAEDSNRGTLLNFSGDRLVIRRNGTENHEDYDYFLIVQEGYLTVYHSDMSSVYLNTYLPVEELPEEERELLKGGFYIRTIEELYDYLESVTS